jgi:hypothetical protein
VVGVPEREVPALHIPIRAGEMAGGDETAAARGIEAIRDIDVQEVDEEFIRLTAAILSTGLIPAKA